MNDKTHPILECNAEYEEYCDVWCQTRAAIKGKNAIVKIITQLPPPMYTNYANAAKGIVAKDDNQQRAVNNMIAQGQAANDLRTRAYWARGRYLNATGRTSKTLNGMIWSKSPEVELNPQIEYMLKDCTGSGISLNDFTREVTGEQIDVGRHGVLVDMPQMEGRPTIAQVEAGFAPRFVPYKAECIFNYRVDNKSGKLAEVRLFETQLVKKDEYNYKEEKRIRRLVLIEGVYTNELYDDAGEMIDEPITPRMNGRTMDFIPFFFFGSESNTPEVDNPPLYDLAQTNLGHFVLDCDNRDNLHYHGQGMTNVFTDLSPEEFAARNPAGLDVGAKGRNMFQQGDRVEILQLDSTGALPAEMERDQQRMVSLGAQLVQDVNTNVTLGAKELEFGASVSQLKQVSYNGSEGMTQCLNWAAMFLGNNSESNTYKLNTDFVTDNLTPEMLNHYFLGVQAGLVPDVVYWENLRKAGATKLEDDEIKTLIADGGIQGESEEMARLRAENDALKASQGDPE